MADNVKKKRPKPKAHVDALRNRAALSETERNLLRLKNYTLGLIEELEAGDLPKEAIAFETILSAFGASEGGLDHSAIKAAYPIQSWREETITLPKALIRVIVEAWVRYKSAPQGKTLGECMNLEGGGQGNHPAKERIEQLNKEARLSNEVLIEYLALKAMGGHVTWEKAYASVAENTGVSEATAKRASDKRKARTLEAMARDGLLDEPKN